MLLAAAILDLGFFAFHLGFWRIFGWPERLAGSGSLNAAITQTLNAMLAFVFAAYGAALFWLWQHGLSLPPLLVVGAGFWTLRLVMQFALFDLRSLPSKVISAVFAANGCVHLLAAL